MLIEMTDLVGKLRSWLINGESIRAVFVAVDAANDRANRGWLLQALSRGLAVCRRLEVHSSELYRPKVQKNSQR